MALAKAEPGKTRIGWIGTGVMGRWMCQHLIGKGYSATVYNRSRDKALQTRIESQAGRPSGRVAVWEMNHPDLKATHTFGDDRKVRPATRTVDVTVQDGGFVYTFPAHSLTILKVTLAQ